MNKPQNLSVGIHGDANHIEVWCAQFTLRGALEGTPQQREEARKRIEKKIADVLRGVDFGDLT